MYKPKFPIAVAGDSKTGERTTETVPVADPLQLELLQVSGFPKKMKEQFPALNYSFEQQKNEMNLEGIKADILEAKACLHKTINAMSIQKVDGIAPNCLQRFQSKPVRDYIVQKLASMKIISVWEVREAKLIISSFSEYISACVKVVTESVVETVIPTPPDSSIIFSSNLWQRKVAEMDRKYPGLCELCPAGDKSEVRVVATDNVVEKIRQNVFSYLTQHAIVTETVHLRCRGPADIEAVLSEVIQNLSEHCLQIVSKEITRMFISLRVTLIIKGTSEGLQLLKRQLESNEIIGLP